MKHVTNSALIRYCFLSLILSISHLLVLAQDSTITATTTTSTSTEQHTWYTQPWAWVVGGIVFILLLVALLRGKGGDTAGRTDKITVTKTVSRDTDV